MNYFVKLKGIIPQSFYDYTRPDKSKRHAMGAQQGKPSLISQHNSEVFCQISQLADRANEGLTPRQLLVNMQRLTLISPSSNQRIIINALSRRLTSENSIQGQSRHKQRHHDIVNAIYLNSYDWGRQLKIHWKYYVPGTPAFVKGQ